MGNLEEEGSSLEEEGSSKPHKLYSLVAKICEFGTRAFRKHHQNIVWIIILKDKIKFSSANKSAGFY